MFLVPGPWFHFVFRVPVRGHGSWFQVFGFLVAGSELRASGYLDLPALN